MAWIYLAVSAESPKLSTGTSGQSPTVKLSLMREGFFCHEWPMDHCHPLQSGTTSVVSQPTYFQRSTLSMAVSPAKTLALRDAESAWAESEAAYFSRLRGSSEKSGRRSSSSKTYPQSALADLDESSKLWPISGTTVAGVLYPLPMWERITKEKDGFSWPTPRANKTGGYASQGYSPTLEQVVMWPTPACNPSRGLRSGEPNDKNRIRLEPTGGKLNPTWVEWLMGYPSGWTVCEPWAIAWFQRKSGKHSRG